MNHAEESIVIPESIQGSAQPDESSALIPRDNYFEFRVNDCIQDCWSVVRKPARR